MQKLTLYSYIYTHLDMNDPLEFFLTVNHPYFMSTKSFFMYSHI